MMNPTKKEQQSPHFVLNLISKHDFEKVRKIVSSQNDLVYWRDEYGGTLLTEAAASGNIDIVELLVEFGSDVNQLDFGFTTPLIHAAYEEHWDIFEYLFSLTSQEIKEQSLFISVLNGDIEIVKALTEKKVDVDAYRLDGEGNIQGLTALLAAIKEEYLEIVDLLIKSGANPNLAENDTGGTPLMCAAKLGYVEIVNLLLNAGADPTIQDIDGETALMKAEKFSKNEVVEILHLYTN